MLLKKSLSVCVAYFALHYPSLASHVTQLPLVGAMLYSRVSMVNEAANAPRTTSCVDGVRSFLQETYDIHEDDEDAHSNDPSLDFYDAQQEKDPGTIASLSDIRINVDPTERLIDAIESLREVIVDNTNAQKPKRRAGAGGAGRGGQGASQPSAGYRPNGNALNVKDDKLRIRKEKVRKDAVSIEIYFKPSKEL